MFGDEHNMFCVLRIPVYNVVAPCPTTNINTLMVHICVAMAIAMLVDVEASGKRDFACFPGALSGGSATRSADWRRSCAPRGAHGAGVVRRK